MMKEKTERYCETLARMIRKETVSSQEETDFRKYEEKVIKEVSANQNCVIATGGGAVLKKENVKVLKQNGSLIFIDRPLENLITTNDRPLSSNRDDLEKTYQDPSHKI